MQNNLNKGEKQAVTQDIANKKDVFLMLNNDFNINRQQELQTELKADINFAQNNNEAFSSLLGNNSFSESAEELSEDLKNHIREVTRRYGRLCWQW